MLPTTSATDQQILDGYLETGQVSLQVYESFNGRAFLSLRRKGANEEVADELVHDAWIPFLRKLPDFEVRGDGGLSAYFTRTCEFMFYSYCADEKRNRSKWEMFVDNFKKDDRNVKTLSALDEEETWFAQKEKLIALMMKNVEESLRSKCRQLIQYRYWDNFPLDKIDELIGSVNAKGTSSAKNELYRCRKKLKALLENAIV